MSLIYNTSLQNFSENPNKIFFHDLENELSGTQCLERVEKIKDFLVENNIESLGSAQTMIYFYLFGTLLLILCVKISSFSILNSTDH